MNDVYLERAKERIDNPKVLAVVASKRARQLARGAKRMIKTSDKEYLDIALLEIAEGMLDYKGLENKKK